MILFNSLVELTDILVDVYDPLNDAIADFAALTQNGNAIIVSVDRDGVGADYSMQDIAKLEGISDLSLENMVKQGHMII